MAIQGITNRQQTEESKFLAAKVYLGKAQVNGKLGNNSDLKTRFRIHPLSDAVGVILKESYYGKPGFEVDAQGDIYVDQLNIYAAFEDTGKTCSAWMKAWSAQKLLRVCDRNSIKQECQTYEDRYGHTRTRMAECDKPCPVAEDPIQVDCPLGCDKEIVFKFYIQEIIEGIRQDNSYAKVELPCEMTIKGETNFQPGGILDQVNAIALKLGSIKSSPFPCGTVGNMIPLILSRTEIATKRPVLDTAKKVKQLVGGQEREVGRRTGQKASMMAYPVVLSVNPVWEAHYIGWQRQSLALLNAREMHSLGLRPSAQLLLDAQVVSIEPEPIKVAAKEVEEESAQSKCDRVRVAREQLNYSKSSLVALMSSVYDAQRPQDLTSKQVDHLIELMKNQEEF